MSVTLPKARTLVELPHGTLVARAGTQLGASANNEEVRLIAHRPLRFRTKLGPEIEIEAASYNFETSRFQVDAKGAVDSTARGR